ncbi:MAG TPA: Uma2 family endonuclease [Herpetosiphonaceae bacterium]|nr:Uma2 family endonuclease [Herpetosiphonaceae bacterium]
MAVSRPLTAAEFAALEFAHDTRTELVHGRIVKMSPGGVQHSQTVVKLMAELMRWCQAGAGGLVGAQLGCVLAPNMVRSADVSYLSPERSASIGDQDQFLSGPPDLAVEVVSLHERAIRIEEKILDYLAAGTPLLWVIYPRLRSVHMIRPGLPRHVLTAGATLSAPDILPGFALSVESLFE